MRQLADLRARHTPKLFADIVDTGQLFLGKRTHVSGPPGHEALLRVVLVRRTAGRRTHQLASLLIANVGPLAAELEEGCIVVVEADRFRIRALPIS